MGAQKRASVGSRGRAALPVVDPRAPSARARAPRRGRERATHLGSFGRMWPSSPRGRAIKMVRGRGGSSDDEFWQFQVMRPRHQEGAAVPLPISSRDKLEELYHGGVSPT
ncbi:hypothetical protein PIB30_066686 [Stylosanthes scabra]|uniref:Uncharacterized protein n=1 Tax=Stylosanthes scabra TaxID=79078 RepID=A0ABU6SNR9_9FABA|nr:hypothetical protein [Stylosanthes scabra]